MAARDRTIIFLSLFPRPRGTNTVRTFILRPQLFLSVRITCSPYPLLTRSASSTVGRELLAFLYGSTAILNPKFLFSPIIHSDSLLAKMLGAEVPPICSERYFGDNAGTYTVTLSNREDFVTSSLTNSSSTPVKHGI